MTANYRYQSILLIIDFISFWLHFQGLSIAGRVKEIPLPHGQYKGQNPKIQFSVSKRGGQLLWLDGLKYFRNNENRTNFFWRCHWYYRRVRCPVLICMNKFDLSDFRQIHKHCHVKTVAKKSTKKNTPHAAITHYKTE